MVRGWKVVVALSLGSAVAGFRCPGDDPSLAPAPPPAGSSGTSSIATSSSAGGEGALGGGMSSSQGGANTMGGGGSQGGTPCGDVCQGQPDCTLACESHVRWCGTQETQAFLDCFEEFGPESSILCAHTVCPVDCPSLCKELGMRGCMPAALCESNCQETWEAALNCGPIQKHALGRCVLGASNTTCLADVNACLADMVYADATPCVGDICIDNWGTSPTGPLVQCPAP